MVFIIVPAYNEAKKIGRVIAGLFEHGFKNVVVVDDGSSDETAVQAAKAGAIVLKHAVNRGQGAALQTGDEFAIKKGAQVVVHFDADGQFNPADILPALQMMREGNVDVVLGSRFLDTRSRIPWTKKYILLPISRLINRFLTGLYLTDVHNGFRVLSRRALEKINISQDRMAHNSDIVKQIKEKGLVYIEHPVEVVYHEYGQGLSGGVQILQDIAKAKIFK